MKFLSKRIITRNDNEEYLIRWNIFQCKWFSIKIHKIILSDDDCLHDHPWAFYSFILKGGYLEHSEEDIYKDHTPQPWGSKKRKVAKYFKAGSLLYRPAEFKHKLEIEKPVWTLVLTLKKVRQWGFWTPKGFIPWFRYKQTGDRCE
jgi:hypothetical protein